MGMEWEWDPFPFLLCTYLCNETISEQDKTLKSKTIWNTACLDLCNLENLLSVENKAAELTRGRGSEVQFKTAMCADFANLCEQIIPFKVNQIKRTFTNRIEPKQTKPNLTESNRGESKRIALSASVPCGPLCK